MKIIHCADIHLGSKMEAKLPKDKADNRKMEVRLALTNMVDYAKNNGIRVIMLCGDVFDSDCPLKKDKEFFYNLVAANSSIDFLYLRGNHDIKESYSQYGLKNLKTFSSEWQTYEYGGVAISGIEMSAENADSIYSTLSLNANKVNIVMLHGQIDGGINLSKLRNKNINYLALGHIHYFFNGKLDDRGVYVNPGCLEGRGFDEIGVKGFVEIDIGGAFTYRFVPNSVRVIEQRRVDISGCRNTYEATERAFAEVKADRSSILRVELVGEIDFDNEDLALETQKRLADSCYFADVKDSTMRKFNIEEIQGDLSLKGEFIRTVMASGDFGEAEKAEIISLGLKALSGREV
ncbi:MAG: metallophosphoesterase family protein [Clostridia bacterium]|nr:metallophosphoesterase family protein [Clostridia bacterium]